MKITVDIRYPYHSYFENTVEIDIPEAELEKCGGNLQIYLDDEEEKILIAQGAEEGDELDYALDVGNAFVTLAKKGKP